MENSSLILLCVPQTWAQTAWPTFNPGQQEILRGKEKSRFHLKAMRTFPLITCPCVYAYTCNWVTVLWIFHEVSQACPGWLYLVKKTYKSNIKAQMCLHSCSAGFMATAKGIGASSFLTMGIVNAIRFAYAANFIALGEKADELVTSTNVLSGKA